ncbi:MAG: ADP-glyceromanno-heptose 6-epimerase [bacterium]|nr:ADP-glyceromanno-heptose 6-epimerase [bacterium]
MIIVTGGAGFIGSAVVWELNRHGEDDLLVVDRLGSTEKWHNLVNLRYREYQHKDHFLQRLHAAGLPAGTRAVLHMGACSSTTERDADYLMANNVHYSRDLARACAAAGVRFVYASSAATYGDGAQGYGDDDGTLERLLPLSIYGYSKHLFDLWMRREGLLTQAVGFKFFNVYGVNEYHKGEMRSMVLKAFHQIRERHRVKLFASHRPGHGDGDERRDFLYVKDAVAAVVRALEPDIPGGIYNLGTGQPRSFLELVTAVFAALGLEPEIDWVAMPPELRDQYQYHTCAQMEKARRVGLPVPATPLEDAVRDYVAGYLVRGHAHLGDEA